VHAAAKILTIAAKVCVKVLWGSFRRIIAEKSPNGTFGGDGLLAILIPHSHSGEAKVALVV
jgi:hypothetical protein